MIGTFFQIASWPFRVVFGAVELIGRMASLVLGFVAMVGGAALLAGPYLLIGAPLFLFGLVLTLRALG